MVERDEDFYKEHIAEEIRRVADLEENQEAASKFWETLGGINAKACRVKYGWHSGSNISFTLAFELCKEEHDSFDLFIDDIKNDAEIFGFICGLYPEVFHYNPLYTITDETHTYMKFKLKRNE